MSKLDPRMVSAGNPDWVEITDEWAADDAVKVEFHPFGFCVTVNGAVVAGEIAGQSVPLIFHGRVWADWYATAVGDAMDGVDGAMVRANAIAAQYGHYYR